MTRDIYAGERIAYMNARRQLKPGQGGKNYAVTINKAADRERRGDMTELDVLRAKLAATFAESRALVNELRNQIRSDFWPADEIPF